jgi:hypothetical protein
MSKATTNQWPETIATAVLLSEWFIAEDGLDFALSSTPPAEALLVNESMDDIVIDPGAENKDHRLIARGSLGVIGIFEAA